MIFLAHVKWFSDFNYLLKPLPLTEIYSPVFWILLLATLACFPLFILLEKYTEDSNLYKKMNAYLDQFSDSSTLVIRIGLGAVLLMSWQSDSMVAPEISIPTSIAWLQLLLVFFLLFKETSFLSGIGVVGLYGLAIYQEGIFHLLDYYIYFSVGLFLILSEFKQEKIKNLNLPILYFGLGFSLCWVAFEKLIYPSWGLSVLADNPKLTMGLNANFFLLCTAFIEFFLGYLLIICLFQRPIAITITLTFFITTSFFGKTEIVGHTLLHATLLVFILKGAGKFYTAPIKIHNSFLLKNLFAIVNFLILFFTIGYFYEIAASKHYEKIQSQSKMLAHPKFIVNDLTKIPQIKAEALQDLHGGWNLHIITENFQFTPEKFLMADVQGEGHAHLFINGKKIGRIYSPWYHLQLSEGKNTIKISLNTNSHKDYSFNGEDIFYTMEIVENRKSKHIH